MSAACATTPACVASAAAACSATAAASGSVPHSSGVCSASRSASDLAGFMNASLPGALRSASPSRVSASSSRPGDERCRQQVERGDRGEPDGQRRAAGRGPAAPGCAAPRAAPGPPPRTRRARRRAPDSTTSAPRATARPMDSARSPSDASAVWATTTSSGPIQLGTASDSTTGTGHIGPSSAASMTNAGVGRARPAQQHQRAGAVPGERRRPSPPAAACAVERTWAPAVAAERSTPPVSRAARARASPRRVSSSPVMGSRGRAAARGCRLPPGSDARTRCTRGRPRPALGAQRPVVLRGAGQDVHQLRVELHGHGASFVAGCL